MKQGTSGLFPTPLRSAAFVTAIAAFLIVIVALGIDVTRKINTLGTANSDNIQWSLSQVEVDLVLYQQALVRASARQGSLSSLRQRFDVLYSRIDTIRTGRVFADLRSDPEFALSLAEAKAYADGQVPLIDGPDDALESSLSSMQESAAAIQPAMRSLALEGVRLFARDSDADRTRAANTLMRLAAFSAGLFVLLAVGLFALLRLYGRVTNRSRETQMISARMRSIVATSLDAIVVANRGGRILDYNGAAEEIFGYSRDEVLGRRMSDCIIPEHFREAHEAGMDRYRRTGEKHVIGKGRVQLEAIRKNGEVFPVELSINVAENEDGEIFISFLRDISARVAAEAALVQARDDALAGERAKAELLAVMSHEMRTPLNGMIGAMELLGETGLKEKQADYLRIMETSGQLLLHHVNDVLDISSLDSGRMEVRNSRFDLQELVDEIIEGQAPLAQANGNSLEVRCGPGDFRSVTADPVRIRQILLNLVSNAIKFTNGGQIVLEMEILPDSSVVEFRVSDTGVGIPQAELENIFDDFVTVDSSYARRTSGTGLGLAITRRLVFLMGGEIGVESEPGEGSLFWIRLPMTFGGDSAPEPSRESGSIRQAFPPALGARHLRILMVEDNAINRQVTREMLAQLGHQVVEAPNGAEGVAAASREAFDVILMDISMPEMDGVEATRRIRSKGASRDSRIIALTAHALAADVERFSEAGMDQILVKPISRARLAAILEDTKDNPEHALEPKSETVDASIIGELHSTVGGQKLRSMLTIFVADADALLVQPSAKMDAKKRMAFSKDVHKLAGSAAVFGAVDLNEHLAALETAAAAPGDQDIDDLLEECVSIWKRTREELERFG